VIVSSHRVVVRNNKQQTEIRNSDAIILAIYNLNFLIFLSVVPNPQKQLFLFHP